MVYYFLPPTFSFGQAIAPKPLLRTDNTILLNTMTVSQSSCPINSEPESPSSSNANNKIAPLHFLGVTSPFSSKYCQA